MHILSGISHATPHTHTHIPQGTFWSSHFSVVEAAAALPTRCVLFRVSDAKRGEIGEKLGQAFSLLGAEARAEEETALVSWDADYGLAQYFAHGVKVVHVAGGHTELLAQPHVQTLREQVCGVMDAQGSLNDFVTSEPTHREPMVTTV
jgi:hypothetical protein